MPASDHLRRPSSWIEIAKLLVLGPVQSHHEVTPAPPRGEAEALVQLHVAEYQALTTRITYWIPIQYSLGGAMGLTLVNFLQAYASHSTNGLHTWATVIVLEILAGAYCFVLSEIMTDSDYIENKLSKRIAEGLPKNFSKTKEFWGNQQYRNATRIYSPSGMYIPLVPCIGAPYAALLFFRPAHRESIDFVFATLSIGLAFWAFWIAYTAVSTQRKFAP